MPEIKDLILQVLNKNKPIADDIHPEIKGQAALDIAIELTQHRINKEVGLAIHEFYEANGIKN